MVQDRGGPFHAREARDPLWYSAGRKVQTPLRIRSRVRRGCLAVLVAAGGVAGVGAPAGADDIRDRISFNGFMGVEYERQLDSEGFGDPKGSFDSDVIG